MAMSGRIDLYFTLERIMIDLDDANDPLADTLRDLMDPIWYGLSDEERALLNARKIDDVRLLNPIRLAAGKDVLFIPHKANDTGYRMVDAQGGVGKRVESGWERAA